MIQIYKKIWKLFSEHEKRRVLVVLFFMIIMALFEVIGVGSVVPFLAVLGDPEIIQRNEQLKYIYNIFEFSSTKTFLMFLGSGAIAILFISAGIKAITSYGLFRFSNMRRHSIAKKLLVKYLHQPYSYFIMQNSSDLSKKILSETDLVISQVIIPTLNLTTYLIVSSFLILFLLFVNPILALVLLLSFGGFYVIMYMTVRKFITSIGKERTEVNSKRFKVCSETIGGIKDIKILGKENTYLKNFDNPSFKFSDYSAKYQTISQLPQYLVEVLAFGAILAIAMYSLNKNQSDLGTILPILGLYAIAALKLKPAIGGIYASFSSVKFGISGLDVLLNDLYENTTEQITIKNNGEKIKLKEKLILSKVSFIYPNTTQKSLKNIRLEIKANTMVGIIGTTGAGKSTLVDMILGLLYPASGEISVDGTILNDTNIRQWQNSIGYVPQSIFLSDDSISSNIAFGIEKNDIDMAQVEKVAKMAQVHEFVSKLDNGYNTIIGERGVRLSGGQRQRLGIARALYHEPDILVLDEATSALDNQTEAEVMNAIDSMSGSKTIIMIAHRLTTVERCDKIIKLKNGEIVDA
ncbi:ABC transporter ATP-binding protein [Aliarcobacter skirrowii]|uniref:ABC transporter ATP-binding protein n=1 Tax=Aliarcobacter skirrowii TaxID=28200 RepID=UPI000826AC35|nr:ABC transporter ATP-binding protein [Aliarcobacter skirrowii]